MACAQPPSLRRRSALGVTFFVLVALVSPAFRLTASDATTVRSPANCVGERESLPSSRRSMWLNDVSGVTGADVWAVGWEIRDTQQPLIVKRSEAGWERQPVPAVWDGELNAVSARTARDVWAVGFRRGDGRGLVPLAVHFDGVAWSITRFPPRLIRNLYDVVSTGPGEAWAVGTSGGDGARPVLLRYAAGKWDRVHPPSLPARGYLGGLDRVGAGKSVVAVGTGGAYGNDQAIALSFDGSEWTREKLPDNTKARLWRVDGGLSVGLSTDIVDKDPVVLARASEGWTRLAVGRVDGHITYLQDLSVTRARGKTLVVAVGSIDARRGNRNTTVLLKDSGGTWTVLESPNPSLSLNQLLGVWSTSPADGQIDTFAVGTYFIGERSIPLVIAYLRCRS